MISNGPIIICTDGVFPINEIYTCASEMARRLGGRYLVARMPVIRVLDENEEIAAELYTDPDTLHWEPH